jgi:hypothetical protein
MANYPNVFETLKQAFQNETGKKWSDDLQTYCLYVSAKSNALTSQMMVDIVNNLIKIENKIPLKF